MLPAEGETTVPYWVGFEEIDPAPLKVARAFYHVSILGLRARRWPLDTR